MGPLADGSSGMRGVLLPEALGTQGAPKLRAAGLALESDPGVGSKAGSTTYEMSDFESYFSGPWFPLSVRGQ